MKPRTYFHFLLFLLCFGRLNAQTGREFWFAAPDITEAHADRPIKLFVSTFDKAATITVSQPANSAFTNVVQTLQANSTVVIDLTSQISFIETQPPNKILNTGLLIESSQDVSAYYEVDGTPSTDPRHIDNSDIFVLKGNNALGDTFFIPMQTFYNNQSYYGIANDIHAFASFDIVATSPNTQVTIFPTHNIVGHKASGGPFTITLQKGQTFSAQATSIYGKDRPTGSKVVANKPIAITLKDDSMLDTVQGAFSWDLAGDQLVSIKDIGDEYIAVRGTKNLDSTFVSKDGIAFTAIKDGTGIFSGNDTIVFGLLAGQTYYYHLLDSVRYFHSNYPIYAFHISAFEYELGGALLPPLACTGAKDITFVRSNTEEFALNIVVKSAIDNNFQLISSTNTIQTLPQDSFRFVPGTNGKWKYAQFFFDRTQLKSQVPYRVTNSHDFLLSVMNGAESTGFRYGFFSGYGSVNLGPPKFFCVGDSVTLDAGLAKDSYLWSTGETTSTIVVKTADTFSVQIMKGICPFQDTVTTFLYPANTLAVLGNDTISCVGAPFSIVTKNVFSSYLWQDHSTAATYSPTSSGTYSVTVTDSNHCSETDSIVFAFYPVPTPTITYIQQAEVFCSDSLVSFSVSETFASYTWFNGQQSSSISVPHTADNVYSVSVTDENQCEGKASVTVDCSPFIKIPNVFTPNGDGANDYFRIKNVELSTWRLEIFDRWGKKVVHKEPYVNDWQAEGLPDAIYFYTLHNEASQTNYKGWVQVIR